MISRRFEFWVLVVLLAIVLSMLLPAAAQADTQTLGLLGGSYGQGRAIAGPELNYTFEKQGIFYSVAAFELERGKTSFNVGVGYRTEISENFFLGFMGAFLFTRIDRQSEEIRDFSPTHFLPLSHSIGLLPWVTLEKQIPLNDSWSVSLQSYFNHLVGHVSLGFTFKGAE
jgi:hypothetical protein